MLRILAAFLLLAFAARAQERPGVHAEGGGVAIGGNVSNSTIGVPYEKLQEAVRAQTKQLSDLTDLQKDTIALLKEKLDLNQRQVEVALAIVGEADVPPERLAAKLVEIAEKFKDLQTAAAAQPGDDARVTALKSEAQAAIADGRLSAADDALASIEKIQSEALDRLALNAAQTTSQRGDVALAQLRYRDAAKRFEDAAARLPQGHDEARWTYLEKEAAALYRQGDEFGDNPALGEAVDATRRALALAPRAEKPLDWAASENALGLALEALGERESGEARLEDAVGAYRDALQEATPAAAPILSASIENNLGVALAAIGELGGGAARLEEAVAAYKDALRIDTRTKAPLLWAATTINLGDALESLGELDSGEARLAAAIGAYREALQDLTPAAAPFLWAKAKISLGNALESLGEREDGTARFEQAVAAYREALQINTRTRVPLLWAQTQLNIGNALDEIGERRDDAAQLNDAAAAYREALQEYTRERSPHDWSEAQNNLGAALEAIGEGEHGTARLEEAVEAYGQALQERPRPSAPLLWAESSGGQGVALMLIAERRRDGALAKTALAQIEAARAVAREGGDEHSVDYFEDKLPRAREIVQRLGGR